MSSGIDVGARVGDTYEVTRLLGRGGMGEVWLAKHLRLPGKQVAIKVLHVGGAQLSADALARFRREAEVATRIGHPNIVEVHDFNTLPDGAPYLVLEFLQGESLGSRLRHPIDLAETQRILRQVGSALQAAHAHGVVHRDLKPDNIFLVAAPMGTVVKVLDFGISKVIHTSTLQTQEAVLVGTPAYMSPEQALGNNKDVGPQSDVFALGAIAYEMLTGKQPFSGESIAQMVMRIAYEPHPPLATVGPHLPPAVVAAVEHALKKDRAQRTADVATFVLEFTGEPLPAPVLRPDEGSTEPSGVATPGMATPNSVMMARTAAPTPGPVPGGPPVSPSSVASTSSAPVAPPGSPGAPTSQFGRVAAMLAGLVVASIAAVVFFRSAPSTVSPRQAEPPPVAIAEPDAPKPATPGAVAAVDAGSEAVPTPAAAVKRPAGAKLALPPEAERAQLASLERLVAEKKFRDAAIAVDVALRLQLSEVGSSFAALLATEAACGNRSLEEAGTRFRQITELSHKSAAQRFCAEYGLTLSP